MPLYEYECAACGHRFERIQKFSDPPERTCPKCGGELHKLVGAPAMKFKGSGWYVTDYGKGTKGTKDAKDSKDSKDTKESKDTKDSKESSDSKDTKTTKEGADSGTKESKSTKDSTSNTPDKS
jgi:putative FmdB family regulatory protein